MFLLIFSVYELFLLFCSLCLDHPFSSSILQELILLIVLIPLFQQATICWWNLSPCWFSYKSRKVLLKKSKYEWNFRLQYASYPQESSSHMFKSLTSIKFLYNVISCKGGSIILTSVIERIVDNFLSRGHCFQVYLYSDTFFLCGD